MGYDYNMMLNEMNLLVNTHRCADMFCIGESVMEKKIPCIKIGNGSKKLFINGAHHGLEYISSAFIMKFLYEYSNAYENQKRMFDYDIQELFSKTTLYAVPMVNPDGVDIAVNGLDITNPYHRNLISLVGIHSFNKVWQANVNAVDINHNYDAMWAPVENCPSPSRYSGPYPQSEPETKAVVDLIKNESFDMLIAFHSQGEEIYYDFEGNTVPYSYRIAEKMSEVSGYRVSTPQGSASFGGCKDWFIQEYKKPGFTVEIGVGKNPLPINTLNKIYPQNSKIVLCALNSLSKNTV